MNKLVGLKAAEVSLVPQGANRRRFMVYKSAQMNELQDYPIPDQLIFIK